jgi:anti-anti-sigma factor
MKRQPSAPTIELDASTNKARTIGRVGCEPDVATIHAGSAGRSAPAQTDAVLSSVGAWTHTVALTGALTRRSAHELEVEIEQRCAEGATAIVLDLSELEYIDPIGVSVIAFRSGLCRRRGYGFTVIVQSPMLRRAFARAGVEDLLAGAGHAQGGRYASLPATAGLTGERGA